LRDERHSAKAYLLQGDFAFYMSTLEIEIEIGIQKGRGGDRLKAG
jgi:hypothetical protein